MIRRYEPRRLMNDFAHIHAQESPLYPEIAPRVTGMLPVDGLHTMYWEECGNVDGVPLLFIHGGPGGGSLPHHRRFYDPSFWRIVLYDQRGAGRSTPVADIVDNTTAHLVNDLDRLRAHIGVERWVLFGGSWGSTLALAYAQTYPQRVLGLVLRGIFLATPNEIEWFLYGMRYIFPEAWRAFTEFLPEDERDDLLTGYYKRLVDADPAVHLPAARAWSVYEGSCSTLLPNPALVADFATYRVALGLARIEAHYFRHDIFLPPNSLLDNARTLAKIPGVIVQGRYD